MEEPEVVSRRTHEELEEELKVTRVSLSYVHARVIYVMSGNTPGVFFVDHGNG